MLYQSHLSLFPTLGQLVHRAFYILHQFCLHINLCIYISGIAFLNNCSITHLMLCGRELKIASAEEQGLANIMSLPVIYSYERQRSVCIAWLWGWSAKRRFSSLCTGFTVKRCHCVSPGYFTLSSQVVLSFVLHCLQWHPELPSPWSITSWR